jgi:hypothetical protein
MPTRHVLAAVASVAAAAAALAVVSSATASAPLHGTGQSTLVGTPNITSVRQADGNTIIEQTDTRQDVGAFTGIVNEVQRLVVHPDGHITTHATASITGTYAGCGSAPVTQNLQLEGQISEAGDITANFTTTGNAPVTVHGTVSGTTASNIVDFAIDYHC